jgi:hypothetical protein
MKDLFSENWKSMAAQVRNFDAGIAPAVAKASNSFNMFGSSLKSVGLLFGAYFTRQALDDLSNFGARAEDMSRSFKSLATTAGIDSVSALDSLREATRNTVSDVDLMAASNRALMLGAAQTSDDLSLLAEAGRRLGSAMGRTAKEGFEDLATGIGRGSSAILDNLGVIVKAEAAYEAYAQKLGKTTEKLSDNERKTAFVTAAYDALRLKMGQMGADLPRLRDTLDQTGVLWDKFKEKLLGVGSAYSQLNRAAAETAAAAIGALPKKVGQEGIGWGGVIPKAEMDALRQRLYPTPAESEQARIQQAMMALHGGGPTIPTAPSLFDKLGKEQARTPGTGIAAMPEYLENLAEASRLQHELNLYLADSGDVGDKVWYGLKEGALLYSEEVGTVFDQTARAMLATGRAMETAFSDTLFNTLTGKLDDFEAIFLGFTHAILRAFTDMLAQMAVKAAMEGVPGLLTSLFGKPLGNTNAGLSGIDLTGKSWPVHQLGTSYVGRTGLALVHQGERVIPAGQSNGGGNGETHFHFSFPNVYDQAGARAMIHRERDYLIALAREANRHDPATRATIRSVR